MKSSFTELTRRLGKSAGGAAPKLVSVTSRQQLGEASSLLGPPFAAQPVSLFRREEVACLRTFNFNATKTGQQLSIHANSATGNSINATRN